MAGELIAFPHDVAGIAMNLEEDQVGSAPLGDYTEIKRGRRGKAYRTNHECSGRRGPGRPGGDMPWGLPIDDKGTGPRRTSTIRWSA